MNMQHTNIQIMWKEIVFIFLFIYVIRFFTDMYIILGYKNINKNFYNQTWVGLKKKIRKHRKICSVFSGGTFNKKIRAIYNGLCMILSSMALINKKESEFISELDNVKKDIEFELKPFVLALYFRSKNDLSTATSFYYEYSRCIHHDKNIELIMNSLFSSQECNEINNETKTAIRSFKNPAIILLLKDNNLII